MKRVTTLMAVFTILIAFPVLAGESSTMIDLEVRIPGENLSVEARTTSGGDISLSLGEGKRALVLKPFIEDEGVSVEVYTGKGERNVKASEFIERLVLAVKESKAVSLGDARVEIELLAVSECEADCG